MSLQIAKQKRAERKTISDQMTALIPADGNFTAENLAKFNELDAAQNKLKGEIDALERAHDVSAEMNARRDRRAVDTGRSADEVTAEEQEVRAACNMYIRAGMNALSPEQREIMNGRHQIMIQNAQGTVPDTAGGYTVASTMYSRIIDAEKAFGGMLDDGVTTVLDTDTGGPIPIPTDDDTSNEGAIIGENQVPGDQDVKFGSVTLNAHTFSSRFIKVPFALLQDSAIDIEAFIGNKAGLRIARAANRNFTVGNGASAPYGVVNMATLGKTGAAGQVASIISDDLIDLEHSVDAAYRKGARYMMGDTTVRALKKLKDGQGRPLWLSGLAVKEPDTINGYAYTINQHMADMAANAKSMLFGNFQNYFVRRVKGVTMLRLTERFADAGQVGFLLFQRMDGKLVDAGTHPIKYYQNPGA